MLTYDYLPFPNEYALLSNGLNILYTLPGIKIYLVKNYSVLPYSTPHDTIVSKNQCISN